MCTKIEINKSVSNTDTSRSCYDCKHYKYDIHSGFINTPADPYCEATRKYDGFRNFPFRNTKCKLFKAKNCR